MKCCFSNYFLALLSMMAGHFVKEGTISCASCFIPVEECHNRCTVGDHTDKVVDVGPCQDT